jgi:hypothetical protein
MSDLHVPDDLIEALEGLAIRTSQGSFVSMEAVRRLAAERKAALEEQAAQAQPQNIQQARAMAKNYLTVNKLLAPEGPREPSRAVPATEPRPPSRA